MDAWPQQNCQSVVTGGRGDGRALQIHISVAYPGFGEGKDEGCGLVIVVVRSMKAEGWSANYERRGKNIYIMIE